MKEVKKMSRLTIKKRIERLSAKKENNWTVLNPVNPTTKIEKLNSILMKEYPKVTSLYAKGTIEIETAIFKANESLPNEEQIPLVELKNLVYKIIEFFGSNQVWYKTLLTTHPSDPYIKINTQEFRKLTTLYYTPAVLTLSLLKTKLTKEEAEDIDSQPQGSINIDDGLLKTQIDSIINPQNNLNSLDLFLNNVKKVGVAALAKNKRR